MSIETVYSAMREGHWYLPEQIPVDLKPSTVRQHLKHLVDGMVVVKEKKSIEDMGIDRGKGKQKVRQFYQSLQKELKLEV